MKFKNRYFEDQTLTSMNSEIKMDWLDTSLYPFRHQYLELEHGKMHYIDEGDGEVILFVHGTPTWSFLYRNFITHFSKNHRCIAIDHLGFGLSEKAGNFAGRPEDHAQNLSTFIEKMDLDGITLVVHDFGGPIGLGSAIRHHQRIRRIVLFNTWLWSNKGDPSAQKVDRVINSWLGRFLYLNMNFSPKILLRKAFFNKKLLTRPIHQHYLRPFPTPQSRLSLLNLAKSLVGSSDWYQTQWESLGSLEDKPWLIIWGTEDSFITPVHLDRWKERLPHASVVELACGHFVQEEEPDRSIQAVADFLKSE